MGEKNLLPVIEEIQAGGANSLRTIAAELTAREMPAPRGNGHWIAMQVQRVLNGERKAA